MKRIIAQVQIDQSKCVGCGTCTHVCPVGAIAPERERPISRTKLNPCMHACPAGNDIEGFIYLIEQKRYLESWRLLVQTNPFPEITGRVCQHPCETNCNRASYDESVGIASLERFIGDQAIFHDFTLEKSERERPERVAIIGAGPGGLSCGYFLKKRGYAVTLFEAMAEPGGMMRYGIPEYQLPRKVLDYSIQKLLKMGLEIKTNVAAGKDFTLDSLKADGYKAICLSTGAQLGRTLDLDKIQAKGIILAVDLHKNMRLGKELDLRKRVVIIGGGNVAISTAMSCLRLGARKVEVVCLEKFHEMPAHSWEVEEALAEGIEIKNSWGIKKLIIKDSSLSGIELRKCLRVFDKKHYFNPVYDEKRTETIPADTLVLAIGQIPDLSYLKDAGQVKINTRGTMAVNPITMETDLPGVFAAGDLILGDGTVADAIGMGARTARAIQAFLSSSRKEEAKRKLPPRIVSLDMMNLDYFDKCQQTRIERLEPAAAATSFNEIRKGITDELALDETSRCLHCASLTHYEPNKCRACNSCVQRCPSEAIVMKALKEPFTVGVNPSKLKQRKIAALCARANLNPQSIVCFCTATRAEEIAAAILQGAQSPEEVSLETGARTGCTVLCFEPILRLLRAANIRCLPPESGHVWYPNGPTIWDPQLEITKTLLNGKYLKKDRAFLGRFTQK